MTKFVEQFAAQLDSVESQILADLRDFVDWQTQAEGRMFIPQTLDRKSTRLNSSHPSISYAVFCLKKKTQNKHHDHLPAQEPSLGDGFHARIPSNHLLLPHFRGLR